MYVGDPDAYNRTDYTYVTQSDLTTKAIFANVFYDFTDRLHLSAGVTELRPDDDAISFFERADEALYRAKASGKGTVVAIETPTLRQREAPGTASSS